MCIRCTMFKTTPPPIDKISSISFLKNKRVNGMWCWSIVLLVKSRLEQVRCLVLLIYHILAQLYSILGLLTRQGECLKTL